MDTFWRLTRVGLTAAVLFLPLSVAGSALSAEGKADREDRQPRTVNQPICAPAPIMRERLKDQYGESRRGIGIATKSNSILEIYAGPSGSWTAVVTQPTGVSCIMASGEFWEDIAPPMPGQDS